MKVFKAMKYSAGSVVSTHDNVERMSKKVVYYSNGFKEPVENNRHKIFSTYEEAMDFALKYNESRKWAIKADLERNAYFLANLQSQK